MSTEMNVRDIKFALSCLGWNTLFASQKFKDFSADDFFMMIDEANKMANTVLAPLNHASDREGVRFYPKSGKVKTPKGYAHAFRLYSEGGWGNSSMPQEFGGVGLPESVGMACAELFIGGCSAFTMVNGLTRSAADVIAQFGNDTQRAKYLANMVSAKWTGTMCLTEPQAGSDVGAVKTMATPIEGRPGHYTMKGAKCFISFGEHDLAENIIHLVLARTPGSPSGTHGISLFIVPKMKIASDGTLSGKRNDVICGGVEHKMGIHGSPTCTMYFGEKDDCEGELLGTLNDGMKYMFLMMNEARLAVGLQGEALGAASYDAALAYAKERFQGSDIREFKNPDAKKVPIIMHPDVRRMLMTMKAHVESMRALVYHTAHYIDMSRIAETPEERMKYHGWVELLTPVVKAYCSDVGFHVTELGVLVHGGVGYCGDYPAEQYMRDAMITRIYEGTNGIQALDLLARKIPMGGGSVLQGFAEEMAGKLETLKAHPVVGGLAQKILDELECFSEALFGLMDKKSFPIALVNACAILDIFGTLASAFFLAEQAAVAADTLASGQAGTESDDAKFYRSKVTTATFFVSHLLPRTQWKLAEIIGKDLSCLEDVL